MQAAAAGTANASHCCWDCKCKLMLLGLQMQAAADETANEASAAGTASASRWLLGLQMHAIDAGTANASHCSWDCKCKLLLMGFKVAGSTQAGIQTQWCHTHDIGFSGMKDARVGGVASSSVVSESCGGHTAYGGESRRKDLRGHCMNLSK